ncbi:hypothetical protein IV203_008580 [Nitzschia inconspicua]|uniref:Uncharacterized protein n=1 Tax=Nitzschia inconspicua TaxID=303405 RepID=A0A9K3KZC8_9STRA|nr:hypothetical protein IV203_008580 [Nitzschia inconspicua]
MAVVRRRLILGSGSNRRSLALPTRKNRSYNKKQKTRISNNNNTIVITTTKGVASGSFTTSPTRFFFADLRSETVVTPPPPPVKTVRFAVKPSSVIEHCYDKDFFQKHKSELWYPKSHRQEQQKQAQEIIATFKEEHAETVQQFAAMYKDIVANHRRTEDETGGTVSASDIELPLQMRGLEWGITPQLKVRRRRHIRHVLGCADMSLPESFQQVMRHSTSVNSSRAAVTIAQWYAKERMEETNDDSHMSVPTSDQPLQTCAVQASSQVVPRITGLPPRQTLPSKRMCLWQR